MRVKHCAKLLCAAALVCRAAFPESAPSARDLFASGLEFAKVGEFDAAAAQFEEAYRISPNYAVLYNLGQAYIALGKPVEAVQALEKFLELGGAAVDQGRRREVQDLVLLNKKRIGFVSLSVEPPNADVSVDGHPAAKSPGHERFALATGTHAITATANGYAPFIGNLEITREKTATLAITLRAEEVALPSKLAQLAVECLVPAASISLDGGAAFPSATDPFLVTVGDHEISCTRSGYLPFSTRVEVTQRGVTHVACDLRIDPHLAPPTAGILTLTIPESHASVWIDGRRSGLTASLPDGPHRVLVQHSGFEDWTRIVVARPGFPETVNVTLRPTPEYALELRQATQSRRNWAYIVGGAGVALLGSSVALYADNSHRYSSWQQDNDALSRDIQNQRWSPTLSDRAQGLETRAASIQARDDLTIGSAVLGGALLSYAVASWLSARH